jgi:RNA polymerase sigma-70 factor (ECF subfamily)
MSSEAVFSPHTLASTPVSRADRNYASDADSESLKGPGIQSDPAARPSMALSNDARVSDEQLLALIRDGEKEALTVLFRRHARAVRNVAYRILRNEAEAEDLLQELFLFLFRKAHHFDAKKSSAGSWIIQMTYHRAIDRRRYLEFRHHYDCQELHDEQLFTTNGQVSIDELSGKTLLNRLRRELTTEQQQTLELRFFEGYSFPEIAEKTGQTFGKVRYHYYRALERLRSLVSQEKRV